MSDRSTPRTTRFGHPRSDEITEPRRLGHIPAFDGLRGVAVIIVVVAHLNIIVPIPALIVVPGGVVSLDSFFVLSGFLITYLLLREQGGTGHIGYRSFFQNRALRLLPVLFAVMIAHAIYAYFSGISFQLERDSLLSVAFYYTNWRLALTGGDLGSTQLSVGLQHLWSLSVEEQFYLVWPFVVVFLLGIRTRLRTVVIVLVGLMVIIAVHRARLYAGGMSWYPVFIRTDTRVDAMLYGALLAHLWIRGKVPQRGLQAMTWIAAGFLLICLPLVQLNGPFLYYGGLSAIDLACAILVLALIDGRWPGRHLFLLRPFLILGAVSYGLYLWHLPVMFAVRTYGSGWPVTVRVIVALAASGGLTAATYYGLERPALRWKQRLKEKRVARTGVESGTADHVEEQARLETEEDDHDAERTATTNAATLDHVDEADAEAAAADPVGQDPGDGLRPANAAGSS